MDDFNMKSLTMSNYGWASYLLDKITPNIIIGFNSILKESISICHKNKEDDKYLMTFQNLISRIPKWNQTIVETERKRITTNAQCPNLEDSIACFHVIQLKNLTAMRVGTKQKKIDINIPKIDDFIHRVYINTARKIYQNVYLFERNIAPLQIQKNNRELENIINDGILYTIRENIPYDDILKAYLEETIEEDVTENITKEIVDATVSKPQPTPKSAPIPVSTKPIPKQKKDKNIENSLDDRTTLSFNNKDEIKDSENNVQLVTAPKNIEHLENISTERHEARKQEEASYEDEDDEYENKETISISDENVDLNEMDIHVLNTDIKNEPIELKFESLDTFDTLP